MLSYDLQIVGISQALRRLPHTINIPMRWDGDGDNNLSLGIYPVCTVVFSKATCIHLTLLLLTPIGWVIKGSGGSGSRPTVIALENPTFNVRIQALIWNRRHFLCTFTAI